MKKKSAANVIPKPQNPKTPKPLLKESRLNIIKVKHS